MSREVETFCEVEEDPGQGINRRENLHEWRFFLDEDEYEEEVGGNEVICMNVI